MTVPSEIVKMIECCLSHDNHYVKDAVLLPCGSNACKSCLMNINSKNDIKCFGCSKMHKYDDLKSLFFNPTVDILIKKVYLNDLMSMIQTGFNEALVKLESKHLKGSVFTGF